jgi:prevent-host-death family protein
MGRVEVQAMATVPEIVPISDLRQDAAAVVKRARSRRQPIVITQRGRAAAVLVGVEEYERAEHEREILLLLARGEQEIAAGVGADLASVLAEAAVILAEAGQ